MFDKISGLKNAKKLIEEFNGSPIGLMMDPVHFEMKSNKQIIVEGCKSIEQYDENMVKIKVKKMTVLFFGRNLEIKCLNWDSLIINGFITSIEFNT